MATTTAMCTSFKKELPMGGHSFLATATPTGDTSNGSFTVSNLSAATGLVVGMAITGTGIPASTVIAAVGSTTLTLSKAATATNSTVTLTCAADIFKMALIKTSPAGTYGAASTNYTNITGNSDEVSGTGYTATGTALTNVSPTASGTTALWTFSPNPSWTSASFSASAAMIYNTGARLEGTANRSVSTHDFGGTQTVTSGTFTAVMPTADASNAILRIA